LTFSYMHSGRRGFGKDDSPEECHCKEPGCSGHIGRLLAKRHVANEELAKCSSGSYTTCPSEQAPGLHQKEDEQTDHKVHTKGALAPDWSAKDALANCQTASTQDASSDWKHAQWICNVMFSSGTETFQPRPGGGYDGISPVLKYECPYRLEPLLVNMWPCSSEIEQARALGLFLPRTLAMARTSWSQQLQALKEMPVALAKLIQNSLGSGIPCSQCGQTAHFERCFMCKRPLHWDCKPRLPGRPPRSLQTLKCHTCAFNARSRMTRHDRLKRLLAGNRDDNGQSLERTLLEPLPKQHKTSHDSDAKMSTLCEPCPDHSKNISESKDASSSQQHV